MGTAAFVDAADREGTFFADARRHHMTFLLLINWTSARTFFPIFLGKAFLSSFRRTGTRFGCALVFIEATLLVSDFARKLAGGTFRGRLRLSLDALHAGAAASVFTESYGVTRATLDLLEGGALLPLTHQLFETAFCFSGVYRLALLADVALSALGGRVLLRGALQSRTAAFVFQFLQIFAFFAFDEWRFANFGDAFVASASTVVDCLFVLAWSAIDGDFRWTD